MKLGRQVGFRFLEFVDLLVEHRSGLAMLRGIAGTRSNELPALGDRSGLESVPALLRGSVNAELRSI